MTEGVRADTLVEASGDGRVLRFPDGFLWGVATAAYSAKQSAVSRLGQPPASSSSCGRSQWYSVRTGRMPCSSSASTSRE